VRGDAEPAGGTAGSRSFEVDVLDVDADPAARVRYGHKIPVLLFAGEWCVTGIWTPRKCIRPSLTIADRYNRGFVQAQA